MKTTGTYVTGLFLLLAASIMLPATLNAADTRGKISGGVLHGTPDWFKESFFEIADDVDEASEACEASEVGKHVLLFFELNGCPYCDRMLRESFEAEPLSSYIQANFDAIAVNIQGDRDIAFNEELSVTEKELSEILKVTSTPALLFLNADNKTIIRVNGYRAPERFKLILEFIVTRSYQTTRLPDYLQARLDRNVYQLQLRDNPLFSPVTDLSSVDGPLMVIFEDGSCYDCDEFHNGILAHEQVGKEIAPYTIVRLDADSTATITNVHGNKTTPAELARKYEMIYRPGVLVFDDGNLLRRHDSLTYPHHFKESMRYVAGGFYKETDYRSYSERRTEDLLANGVDIDLGQPQ